MKNKIVLIIAAILILCSITCIYLYKNNYIINNNNSTNNINTPIPTNNPINNTTLTYPPNDYVINNINWSNYPNLKQGYILTIYIAEPNEVIPYKFIDVQICTEYINTENGTIIEEQMEGVGNEAHKIYGQNSSINIIGMKNGVACWFVSILPNKD